MGKIKDSVVISRSVEVTRLSRSLLKDAFGQQDGAEFLQSIFNCIDETKDNTFTTEVSIEQRRSSKQVRKLDCNDEPVPQGAVDAFDIKWQLQLSQNNRNKQLLSEYTYDKEKDTIRLMTQGDDRNRHIFRGQPKDTDPDLKDIDWRAAHVTYIKTRSHFIELSTLRRPGQSVCGHIEEELLNPVGDIKGTTRDAAKDLFFFYTLETRKYNPTSKYAIVSFPRTRWQGNSQADDFNYNQQSFTVGDQTYELIAVIHRTGDGTECGHYFVSLKVGSQWYMYNDKPLERKPIDSPSTRDYPYMLLFRKVQRPVTTFEQPAVRADTGEAERVARTKNFVSSSSSSSSSSGIDGQTWLD
jgi:hypothetical protein